MTCGCGSCNFDVFTASEEISVYPSKLVREVNKSAYFYCPGSKVTWKHRKGLLPDNAEVGPLNIINKRHWHVLKISNIQPHNSGYYQCYSEISQNILQEGNAMLQVTCELEYLV